jgi:hypothetical protein
MKLYLHRNNEIVSTEKEIVWAMNVANNPNLDDPIIKHKVTIGIPIKEDLGGDILVQKYSDAKTQKTFYRRVYTKLESAKTFSFE